MTQQLAQ